MKNIDPIYVSPKIDYVVVSKFGLITTINFYVKPSQTINGSEKLLGLSLSDFKALNITRIPTSNPTLLLASPINTGDIINSSTTAVQPISSGVYVSVTIISIV